MAKKTQFVEEFDVCPELQPVIYSKFKGPRSVDTKVSHHTCKAMDAGKKCGRVFEDEEGDLFGRCIVAVIKGEVK